MCSFYLEVRERRRKRERKMALHPVTMSRELRNVYKIFQCIYLNVKANTSTCTHTLFLTQTGHGFSCLIYICTDRLIENVNNRTVKHSNIVSLSFSLPRAFDVVIGAGLAFLTQVELAASGLHAGACLRIFPPLEKTLFVFTTVILYGAHPVS